MTEISLEFVAARLANDQEKLARKAYDVGSSDGKVWAERHANLRSLESICRPDTDPRYGVTPQQLFEMIFKDAPHIVGCGLNFRIEGDFYYEDMSEFEKEHWRQGVVDAATSVYLPAMELREQEGTSCSFGSVYLAGFESRQNAFIDGVPVAKNLEFVQYSVIRALVIAGSRGLSKGQLTSESRSEDGFSTLRALRRRKEWKEVILFPGAKGKGGYRIRSHQRIRNFLVSRAE